MAPRPKPIPLTLPLLAVVLLASLCLVAEGQPSCPRKCSSCSNGVAVCSSSRLTAPPRNYPPDIRRINLRGNYIGVLGSQSFLPHPTVEVLRLSNNRINTLRNDAFAALGALLSLDLSDNRIRRIWPHAFRNLTQLRTLTLSANRIRSVARVFRGVPLVYQINLGQNRIRSIGQNDFKNLTRTHNLDLRDNKISTIHPGAFRNMRRLRYLYLNNNLLTSFSSMQFGATSLQMVDLSYCRLRGLPTPLPASVTELRVGHNRIAQINHTDLVNMTDLQMLAINDNRLSFVADNAMAHLSQLQEIWLRGNRMVYIPRGLPLSVKRLHMDLNSLMTLEEGVFSAGAQLEHLNLDGNQIATLSPDTFAGLQQLRELNLQRNRLGNLPEGLFSDLPSLARLHMSTNPLVHVDDGAFQDLANLTHLDLSYTEQEGTQLEANFLPAMPNLITLNLMNSPGLAAALTGLINVTEPTPVVSSLTRLDLSYNTLTWLTPKIRQAFPSLDSLLLDGNPFRCARRLRWLRDWMSSEAGGVGFFTYEEPACARPFRLEGRPLTSLSAGEWAGPGEPDGPRNYPSVQQQAGVAMGTDGDVMAADEGVRTTALIGPEEESDSEALIGPQKESDLKSSRGKKNLRPKEKRKGKKRRKGKKNRKQNQKRKGRGKKNKKNAGRKNPKRGSKKGKERSRRRKEVFVNEEGTQVQREKDQ